MRLFQLFLLLAGLAGWTVYAIPTSLSTNRLAKRGILNVIAGRFGYVRDDQSIGHAECTSDSDWRSSGFCQVAGPAFPRPTIDPLYASEWEVIPKREPEPAPVDPAPAPAPAPAPVEPPEVPPTTYSAPGMPDYTAPRGLPQTWSRGEMKDFYTHICITDLATYGTDQVRPPSPPLDDAGIATCNIVESNLYDVEDDAAAMEEMTQALEAAEAELNTLREISADGIIGDGAPGGVNPADVMMSGALAVGALRPGNKPPSEISAQASTESTPESQRTVRRTLRKLESRITDISMRGSWSMDDAIHINHLLGANNDPFLSGPGPEDPLNLMRNANTPFETAQQAIDYFMSLVAEPESFWKAWGGVRNHPMYLPPGYSWVQATQAEFGDNWNGVLRVASLMGTDPFRKAVKTASLPRPFMQLGEKGIAVVPKVLAYMGLHGSIPITPEFFAKTSSYGRWWIRQAGLAKEIPVDAAVPWGYARVKEGIVLKALRKSVKFWPGFAALGLIGMTWGIIQHKNHEYEEKMAELGQPVAQRWQQPIQAGQGPWITTVVTETATVSGEVQIETMTTSYQYDPASFTLSPKEMDEMRDIFGDESPGPMITDAASPTAGLLTAEVASMIATPVFFGISLQTPTATPTLDIDDGDDDTDVHLSEDDNVDFSDGDNYVPDDDLFQSVEDSPQTGQGATSDHQQRPRPLPHPVAGNGGDVDSSETVDGIVETGQDSSSRHRLPRPYPGTQSAAEEGVDDDLSDSAANAPDTSVNLSSGHRESEIVSRPHSGSLSLAMNSTGSQLNSSRTPSPAGLNSNGSFGRTHHGNYSRSHSMSWNATHLQSLGNITQSNITQRNITQGNSTVKSSPVGPAQLSQPRYLMGTAPWGGTVIPELIGAMPTVDGNWACSWIPMNVLLPVRSHPGNRSTTAPLDWNLTVPRSAHEATALWKRASVLLLQSLGNSTQSWNGTLAQPTSNATQIAFGAIAMPALTCASPAPQYLKGSACWDGNVVPEIMGMSPNVDGNWTCQWVPYDK